RLRGWLDEDRAGLRLQRHLIDAATTWEDLDHDPGILFRTTRLAATVAWVDRARPALTARERDFLDHSVAAEARARRSTRLRRRLLAAAVGALLTIATVVAIPVVRQLRLADQVELSLNLAARDAANSTEAARNALAAYQAYPTVEARSSLLTAAVTPQGDHRRASLGGKRWANAVISPDGDRLALRAEGSVVLLATKTFEQVAEFPLPGGQALIGADVQFTPDGQTLVAGEAPGRIAFLRLSDGKLLRSVEIGSDGPFAVSPDGRVLAVDLGHVVRLWDVATSTRIGELDVDDGSYSRPAFSDDNRTLAVAGSSGEVEVWDLPTRSRVARLTSGRTGGDVTVSAFSPSGHLLATGDEGGDVVVWDVAARTPVAVVARHAGGVYSVAFSPDGRILASGGESGRLSLWDVEHRTSLADLPMDDASREDRPDRSGIWGLAFARDGTLIASSGNGLFVWSSDRLPADAGYNVTDLRYDGRGNLHVLKETGVLTTWHTTPDLRQVDSAQLADSPVGGRFSPDGEHLVLGAVGKPITLHDTNGNASTELSIPGLPPPDTRVRIAAIADDGRHVLAIGAGQPVVVWDVGRPDAATTVATQQYSNRFTGAAFLRGSTSRIAVADSTGTVKIKDLATGGEVGLDGHHRPATAIAGTPDGRLLATTGIDAQVILWDTSTWQEVGRLTGHTSSVWRAEISPDGRLLATGDIDGTIILWDLDTRSRWATLTGRPGPVTALAWSPDGKTLASAGADSA
ncbi:MAG TPA: WD40 repeat domain-containing protein, partial [Umezawaea sp.]|nr:WD40 repeat domain-containing protein [Umezawaea sp.]